MPADFTTHYPLTCIHRAEAAGAPVNGEEEVGATVSIKGATLTVRFEVQAARYRTLNTSSFAQGRDPSLSHWGLWDETEVVELFLAPQGQAATHGYFEFQVSPENLFFTLRIFEPRKRFSTEVKMPFQRQVEIDSARGVWRTTFEIPLNEYGWTNEPSTIEGGLFAILGPREKRSYWAAFLPHQEKPDYHLPERFRSLLEVRKPTSPEGIS